MLRDNSGFCWYFMGSVTSDFGTWMQNTAQVMLAYQLVHSVLTVGLVTFAQFTSPLVLGPFAGVLADRKIVDQTDTQFDLVVAVRAGDDDPGWPTAGRVRRREIAGSSPAMIDDRGKAYRQVVAGLDPDRCRRPDLGSSATPPRPSVNTP